MTGKPFLDKIFITLNILITSLACGLIIYSHLFIKPSPINEKDEFKNLINSLESSATGVNFKLPPMTVNLSSPQANRLHYIDMEINLIANSNEAIDRLKKNQHKIQDLIIQIGSDMDVEEIGTLSGKILYTEKVRATINEKLGSGTIKQVLFTRFVIQ